MSGVESQGMRKHTVRAVTWLLSAAVAVSLLVVGSSAAVADAGSGHGGRSSMSSGRQSGYSAGRMGRSARGAHVRGGRYTAGRDRGGRRYGWFNRGGRHYDRGFISFGRGSYRRGYRSSGALFFGFSFTASEYRRSSGLRYRPDVRREYRNDAAREKDSNDRRAVIEHPPSQSGPLYAPLVASPAAPELLPLKD
jgi:hypothetical protein